MLSRIVVSLIIFILIGKGGAQASLAPKLFKHLIATMQGYIISDVFVKPGYDSISIGESMWVIQALEALIKQTEK